VKYFAILFSVYLLALSVMPCKDKEDCKHIHSEHFSNAGEDGSDHSGHDKDIEHCSPFCMCSCCGTSCVYNYSYYKYIPNTPVLANTFTIYKTSFIPEVYLAIWQPPKIS